VNLEEVAGDVTEEIVAGLESNVAPFLRFKAQFLQFSNRCPIQPDSFRRGSEAQLGRKVHLLRERHAGIVAVSQPADLNTPAILSRYIVPGLSRVKTVSVVAAQHFALGPESVTVEAADQMVADGSPEGPFLLGGIAVDGEFKQIRAFHGIGDVQTAQALPAFEIAGPEQDVLVLFEIQRHDPFLRRRVPAHLRIAIFGNDGAEDRIGVIVRERRAAVVARRDALSARRPYRGLDAVGQNRDDRLLFSRLETRRVLPIDNRRTRPAAAPDLVRRDGRPDLFPMHQVCTHGVTPIFVRPGAARRHVLEKEVVRSVVVDQPVRIVDPVLLGRKVELRAVFFVVVHRPLVGQFGDSAQARDRFVGEGTIPKRNVIYEAIKSGLEQAFWRIHAGSDETRLVIAFAQCAYRHFVVAQGPIYKKLQGFAIKAHHEVMPAAWCDISQACSYAMHAGHFRAADFSG